MKLHGSVLPLFAIVVLAVAACASSSVVVTGNKRIPIAPEQVKVYLDPPAAFETIGLVNASSDAGWTEQGSVNYAIAELKKQAAKLGANGVLLVSIGEDTTAVVGTSGTHVYSIPVTEKTVQGRAIYVKDE